MDGTGLTGPAIRRSGLNPSDGAFPRRDQTASDHKSHIRLSQAQYERSLLHGRGGPRARWPRGLVGCDAWGRADSAGLPNAGRLSAPLAGAVGDLTGRAAGDCWRLAGRSGDTAAVGADGALSATDVGAGRG